jgi:SHS2 domain-containing protein
MASEEEKKRQLVRVFSLMIEGLAKGIYDLFDDSAYALMKTVGKDLLEIMQKEMGLEIEGENPTDVLNELLRIWVDEVGFFSDASVKEVENGWEITGHHCKGWNLTQKILATGVKEPFTCPVMNTLNAALSSMGVSTRMSIQPVPETKGTKFTLTHV